MITLYQPVVHRRLRSDSDASISFTKTTSLDIAERENDLRLAQHVTYVHQNLTHPPIQTDPLPIKTMQRYLELCKTKVFIFISN